MSYSDLEKMYSKILKQYPPMGFEEQAHCVELAKAGDKNAMDKIIYSNMGLVLDIVAKRTRNTNYKYGSLEFDDLFQEGNIGLMHAVDLYSPECGSKFSSYATWWIDRQIREAMNFDAKPVKFPRQVVERIITIAGMKDWLKKVLERDPSEEEIIRAMGSQFDAAVVKETLEFMSMNNLVELDASLDKDSAGEGETIGSIIKSEEKSPETCAVELEQHRKLMEAIRQLKPKEQALIIIKWGLEDGIQKSLDQTADIMYERGLTNRAGGRITKQGIDQLETKAMQKLQEILNQKFGDEGGLL